MRMPVSDALLDIECKMRALLAHDILRKILPRTMRLMVPRRAMPADYAYDARAFRYARVTVYDTLRRDAELSPHMLCRCAAR